MPEKKESAVSVDLMELLGVLLRKIWFIILSVIIAACLAFGYTRFFVTPLYRSSSVLYVNNSNLSLSSTISSISTGELTAAQKLVDTYIVILKSRTFLDRVAKATELEGKYTISQLGSMITASGVNETQVFQVNVTGPVPEETTLIANAVAALLPSHLETIIKNSDVRVVDYAIVPSGRVSPSYTRNVAIGGLLGGLLCAGVIIVMYLMDENIRDEDYLTQTYPDIPLLSVIPDMQASRQ